MGKLFQLDASGHKNILRWGATADERAVAKAAFDEFKKKGFALFALDADDQQGRRLTDFDPEVHGILAVPQLRGG